MSKLLILNEIGSKEKYSILALKNIEHFEKHMGEPDVRQEISEHNASIQNLGVCSVYAFETIKKLKPRCIFVEMCQESLAQLKLTTDRVSQEDLAKKFGMSRKTLSKYLKQLESDGFLKIEKSNHKLIGAGSVSHKYTPIFKQ